MNLIQKLSTAGVLGSTLAASGCSAVTAGATLWNAHETSRIANSLENRNQNLYKKNPRWPKENSFFTFSEYLGDSNGDLIFQSDEFKNYNKKVFDQSEKVGIGAIILNSGGKNLNFILFGPNNEKLCETNNQIPHYSFIFSIRENTLPINRRYGRSIGVFKVNNKIVGAAEYTILK